MENDKTVFARLQLLEEGAFKEEDILQLLSRCLPSLLDKMGLGHDAMEARDHHIVRRRRRWWW